MSPRAMRPSSKRAIPGPAGAGCSLGGVSADLGNSPPPLQAEKKGADGLKRWRDPYGESSGLNPVSVFIDPLHRAGAGTERAQESDVPLPTMVVPARPTQSGGQGPHKGRRESCEQQASHQPASHPLRPGRSAHLPGRRGKGRLKKQWGF